MRGRGVARGSSRAGAAPRERRSIIRPHSPAPAPQPTGFAAIDRAVSAAAGGRGAGAVQEQHAVRMLTTPLAHTGRAPRDLTSQDMLDMCRRLSSRRGQRPPGLPLAWDLLRQLGVLPPGTPTLHDTQRRQRPNAADMVDFYGLSCPDVRDLIIRYVTERAPAIDYSTTRQLIWKLAKRFWKDLEEHHLSIDTLHLPHDVAQAWKKRTGHDNPDRPYEGYSVLFAVRAFYLDISQWALHDAYWARWAAPCPISLQDTKGVAKHRKHVTARMHQKVRQLAPLLPQLMSSAEERLRFQQEFIDRARATAPGEEFVHGGRAYQRRRYPAVRDHDPTGLRRLYATDPDTGAHVDLLRAEDRAFWTWAVVNTFFYTGVRVEELLEITQTALTTLRLPDSGETVPLLQIVPSKTDAERVLLVPPELAHVLAKVKQRVRDGHETVPVLQRWDPHDRVLSPPLPFLFQRRHGLERRVLTDSYVQRLVNEALAALGHGELKLTPHDFRRLFASEAVSSGLPPHIVAKILGHEHLSTTEHYMAVYPEDMLRHYRAFPARHRQLRPSEEYRDPTSDEWEEFHQHFAKRKVELGTYGRGYGTPCAHEHAPLTERSTGIAQFRARVLFPRSTVCDRDGSRSRAGPIEAFGSTAGSTRGDRRAVRALSACRRRRCRGGAGRSLLPGVAGGREGSGDGSLLRHGPAAVVAVSAGRRRAVGSGNAFGGAGLQLLDSAHGQAEDSVGQAGTESVRGRSESGDGEADAGTGLRPVDRSAQ